MIAPGTALLPKPENTVYVLVGCGISHKPPSGVFKTPKEAYEAAKALWERSDGYHSLEIWGMRFGHTYETFSLGYSWSVPTVKPLSVKVVNHDKIEAI